MCNKLSCTEQQSAREEHRTEYVLDGKPVLFRSLTKLYLVSTGPSIHPKLSPLKRI